jgi:hypothetical protein
MPFSLGILVLTNEGKRGEVIYVRVVGGILWLFPFFSPSFCSSWEGPLCGFGGREEGMKKKK